MKRVIPVLVMLVFVVALAAKVGAADELSGTYINKENKSEYITFGPDGKFFLKQKKKTVGSELPAYDSIEGTFKTQGDTVTLKLPGGEEAVGKFKEGTFLDNERRLWVKEGAPQKMAPPQLPKRKSGY